MLELKIAWRPPKPCAADIACEAIAGYMDHEARFVLFENGTALMLKPELDNAEVIRGAMNEVQFKTDFNVMPMRDGNYLVWLASPVCVFISASEAEAAVATLNANPSEAMFPGESFVAAGQNSVHHLIGLAGRAKGHIDSRAQVQVAQYVPEA